LVTALAQTTARPLNREAILGIDPGSIVTGWGLVKLEGNQLRHVANGIIGTSSALDQADRLLQIHSGIEDIIKRFRPAVVSLEKIFFSHNAQSALKLGQARGMAMLAAAQNQIDISEYSATEIKVAVVGYGHASKAQIQKMVGALLGLRGSLRADAADALAAAICHLHRRTYQNRIAVGRRAENANWRDYKKMLLKR
jgi:crossover junction endodeoxyribonuclease RuvC